jgi:hypothetical protein
MCALGERVAHHKVGQRKNEENLKRFGKKTGVNLLG